MFETTRSVGEIRQAIHRIDPTALGFLIGVIIIAFDDLGPLGIPHIALFKNPDSQTVLVSDATVEPMRPGGPLITVYPEGTGSFSHDLIAHAVLDEHERFSLLEAEVVIAEGEGG